MFLVGQLQTLRELVTISCLNDGCCPVCNSTWELKKYPNGKRIYMLLHNSFHCMVPLVMFYEKPVIL